MSQIDPHEWYLVVEDPDALSVDAWLRLESALVADPILRRRLVAEHRLHERLSRLHGLCQGDLDAVIAQRTTISDSHSRFVREVLQRSASRGNVRSWPVLTLAAAALLLLGLGFGARGLWMTPVPRWIEGQGTVALDGGGSVILEPGSRWLDSSEPVLERGRASLEVAPRRGAPFVVRTPQAAITVLGTRFGILVDSDTEVAVQHGRVRLEGKVGEPIDLEAGDRGRCTGRAQRPERIMYVSRFAADEPALILTGSISRLDPLGLPDPCVAAGVFVTEDGPRVSVAASIPPTGFIRCVPGLQVGFRWWAEPSVGMVQMLVWDLDQERNYQMDLGTADGTWHQIDVPFASLQPFAGLPKPELRAQPGDRLQGVTVIGSSAGGRLYLDDLVFSEAK